MDTDLDRQLETAQAALLGRFAPQARVRRIRWTGGETQGVELGSGPPLLYVHGGLGGAYELVPILSALAESHRVFAVDRPGHGLADPYDYRGVDLLDHGRTFLRDVVDALELATVDVVANSLGALLSVAFALDAPSRVARLVLVGAPFGIMRRPPLLMLPLGLPFIGDRLGRHAFANATRDGSRRFFGQLMVEHPERVDDRLLDVDVAHTRRNAESMLSLIACIADWRRLGYRRELVLGERWRALTTPTLLVWPENDAFGSPEKGEALAAQNPNLRLVRLPGAGHLPWIDDPDTVAAEIERFLATDRRSGADAAA
ncbi:MAG TPA: alpha/beta hydrolase [Solirubrobacteraceae bacterium]|nr:alpha/beta hydrolase [Solirubrobacteraceae bacterium]